jgi:1,4-dihydroxy-2-naphthoyl-CoA hydrolase
MNIKGQIEFSITEQTPERVVGQMPVQPGILNPYGVAHAGAMLWFADVCATLLVLGGAPAAQGQAGFPLGVGLNASILGNQKDGVFTATSVFVKHSKSLSVVRTTLSGADGRLIADVTTQHVPSR